MNTYDPTALRSAYKNMQSGDPRMRAIRAAVTEAEQAGDLPSAVQFHHDLIKESVFSGDRYQALVDFPQYLALVKRDPVLEQENLWDMLWMFKWIVEAATEFPQIEKKQVLGWFSEFRSELLKNGYSLRTWYEKRAIFYCCCDRAKMRLDYEDFLNAPKDPMSDGTASELNSMVRFELELGRHDRAMKAATEIFTRSLHTEEVPCKTFHYLLTDAIRRGDRETADKYAGPLRGFCSGERFQLEPVGTILCYDALTDPARGLQFYAKNKSLRENSRNPFLCFWFDRGAAKLLTAAAKQGLSMQTGGISMHAEQLAEQAESALQNCRELAAKFDARNKSDYFSGALSEAEAWSL